MRPPADLSDAELNELDDLLAAIPAPLQPLDLVMLDGYLCGVIAQPEIIPPERWLPPLFDHRIGEVGEDGSIDPGCVLGPDTPGWHAARHERLVALVLRHHAALEHNLRVNGRFHPVVTVPEDDQGQLLVGQAAIEPTLAPWSAGFSHALVQFPALEDLPIPEINDLLECVFRHLPPVDEADEEVLRALAVDRPQRHLDDAVEDLIADVVALADLAREARLKVETVRHAQPKPGRNEPCPCGSGKKFKHCHGRGDAAA